MKNLFEDATYIKYIGRDSKCGEAIFTQVIKYDSFWDFMQKSEAECRFLQKIHNVEHLDLYPSNLNEYNKALEGEDIRE